LQFKEKSVGRDHGGSSLRPYDTKLEADNQWRDRRQPQLLDNPNKTNKIKKVTPEQLDKVLAAFEKVGKQVGMI